MEITKLEQLEIQGEDEAAEEIQNEKDDWRPNKEEVLNQ